MLNFQIFGTIPAIFPLLIYSLILSWSEIYFVWFLLFKWATCFSSSRMWSSLINVPCKLEKNVYSAVFQGNCMFLSVISTWLIMFFRSIISLNLIHPFYLPILKVLCWNLQLESWNYIYIYSSSINCCLIYFDNLLLGTFKIICSAFSCVKTEWWLPRSSRVRQTPTVCFTLTFNNSFISGILIFSKSLVISNKVTLKFISNYDSMSTPLYPVLVHKHINYLKFSKLLD